MEGFDVGYLREGLLFFLVVVCSLCLHEWAHAWVADRLGDPTPRSEGRVTVNPLVHIDPLGTILFPLLCIFAMPRLGLFLGWARPVPVDSRHFKHPGRGDLLTTAAGPFSNLAIALFVALIGGMASRFFPEVDELVAVTIRVNAWLFVFNLLPLPPLDGGRILRYLVNMSWETFARLSQGSMIVLLIAIYFVPGFTILLSRLIGLAAIPGILVFNLASGRL